MSIASTLPDPLRALEAGPVFVVGQPRSGTTWVYDALTVPDEVCGIFESWMFTTDIGLGRLFEAHWDPDRIDGMAEAAGRSLGLGQLITRDELVRQVRDLTADWLGRALEPGHRFLVEKSPPHLFVAEIIAEVYPEARFVHVVRDGRDVAMSVDAAARSWNPGWQPLDRRAYRGFAAGWRAAMRLGTELREHLGPRFLEVRFEDLKRDPVAGFGRLFEACGLPIDAVQEAVESTDLARRGDRGEDRFRRRGISGGWRERMGRLDRLLFQAGARESLIERGYERSRWWWLRG